MKKHAVIVDAGFAGLELAERLHHVCWLIPAHRAHELREAAEPASRAAELPPGPSARAHSLHRASRARRYLAATAT
jgi:hypothetical protein